MAGHRLIQDHLTALARHLPADIVDELADGLAETWHRHVATGLPPAEAARAAIVEFGTPDQITEAFVTHAPGRRTAVILLATGPVAAVFWGTTLVTSHAWTWPVPAAAAGLLGGLLLVAVATLLVAATARHTYRHTRLAAVGSLAVLALDIAMLATVLLAAPVPAWPLLAAATLSLGRIALTTRLLPRTLAR